MKVAYVLTEFPALSETFVAVECELLARHGVEVIPFSYRDVRNPDLFSPLLQSWNARTRRPRRLFWPAEVARAIRREGIGHIHAHFARGARASLRGGASAPLQARRPAPKQPTPGGRA